MNMNLLTNKKDNRILELDSLRGLAALGVLLWHYTNHFYDIYRPHQSPSFSFQFGCYGFHLFFIISGFVIFMTLEKTKHPLDFMVSRFSRLYPTYWLCVFTTFLAVRSFPLPGREVGIKSAIFNLTMLQNWYGIKNVDGVYWTLGIELAFYAIIFIVFLTKNSMKIEMFGLVWLILMIFSIKFRDAAHFALPAFVIKSGLLTYGHLFFAGILFYNLKTKGNTWQRNVYILLCLSVQFLVPDPEFPNAFVVAAIFIIFYLFVFNRLKFLIIFPLIFLGDISYSFYLIHQNIGYIILYHPAFFVSNPIWGTLVALACALSLATMITYFVEKPTMKFIRNFYKIRFRTV
jgi:peptidoglycan/LPS O-acetylase OafA/YrhL